MSKLYDWTTAQLRRLYDRHIATPAVLETQEFFPGAENFLAQSMALREEALQLVKNLQQVPRFHEVMAEQADISANDGIDWRVFLLKAYGHEITANMDKCPQLAALVRSDPDVVSATLSFLAPHKHIPEHRGPFRGIIRYYQGLDVPTDAGGQVQTILAVDAVEHRIGTGQGILWDDTYPHEVWNRSERVRIALLLDVRRHGMPWALNLLSAALIKIVGTAVRLRGIQA